MEYTELAGTCPAPPEFSRLHDEVLKKLPKLREAQFEYEKQRLEIKKLKSQLVKITDLMAEKLKSKTSGDGLLLEYIPKTADFKIFIEPNSLIKEKKVPDKFKNINFNQQ